MKSRQNHHTAVVHTLHVFFFLQMYTVHLAHILHFHLLTHFHFLHVYHLHFEYATHK